MAAYAYTATLAQRKVVRIGSNPGLAILSGTIDVSNYNATAKAEITEITGAFKEVYQVILSSVSQNGFLGYWNGTSIVVFEATGNAGAAEEADTDDDAGEFDFIAIGTV